MMTKEKFIRGYLYVFSSIWIFYSLFVWVNPAFLASISGLGLDHWSAVVEVRAMYGGLEFGLALFALAGAVFPLRYLRANVLLWMLVNGFLTVGRISGILIDGGTFGIEFGTLPSSYNSGALWLLEGPSALIFAWYWFSVYHGDETCADRHERR
jgi:hypothetical protein